MADPMELMARYCDGDDVAFRELYRQLAPRILGYLVKMAREHATAADLLQQTFIKLHRARAAYIRGADPVPWIYAIAHRVFLDSYRKTKRGIVALDARHEPSSIDVCESDERDPEVVAAALAALAELPDQLRQAVVLMKLEGKSVAEAAEIAGVTIGAMRVRAHRGYKALRCRLA